MQPAQSLVVLTTRADASAAPFLLYFDRVRLGTGSFEEDEESFSMPRVDLEHVDDDDRAINTFGKALQKCESNRTSCLRNQNLYHIISNITLLFVSSSVSLSLSLILFIPLTICTCCCLFATVVAFSVIGRVACFYILPGNLTVRANGECQACLRIANYDHLRHDVPLRAATYQLGCFTLSSDGKMIFYFNFYSNALIGVAIGFYEYFLVYRK